MRPGEVMFADEIVRTSKNKPLKYVFVTDALTRYGVSTPYLDGINSQKFIRAIVNSLQILGTLGASVSSIVLRTDGMPAHTSAETRKALL